MASDPRQTLLRLLDQATTPTDEQDQEARTAAVQACRLLKSHPELLAARAAGNGPGAPPRRDGRSNLHPDAAHLRDWRFLVAEKGLTEGIATVRTTCADCGKPIEKGERVVDLGGQHITTHQACAGWWWKFEVPGPYDDIPF